MAKKVTLDWTDPSPTTYVNQLEIWRKLDGGTYAHIGGAQLGDETYDDESGVTDEEKYYYEVRAYNIDRNYSVVENNITISGFLLDEYTGAEAAYSLRKLKSGISYGVEIRRDVGTPTTTGVQVYDNGDSIDLDSTVAAGGTLGDWVGANSAYIKTWYDQSGNGNDMIQTTDANQPRLIDTGSLELSASLSAINFDGVDDFIDDNKTVSVSDRLEIFGVHEISGDCILYNDTTDSNRWVGIMQSGSATAAAGNGITIDDIYKNGVSQNLPTRDDWYDAFSNGTRSLLYLTGDINTTNWNNFGISGRTGFFVDVNFQELIIYPTDQSSNRTGIETNINNHYSIY